MSQSDSSLNPLFKNHLIILLPPNKRRRWSNEGMPRQGNRRTTLKPVIPPLPRAGSLRCSVTPPHVLPSSLTPGTPSPPTKHPWRLRVWNGRTLNTLPTSQTLRTHCPHLPAPNLGYRRSLHHPAAKIAVNLARYNFFFSTSQTIWEFHHEIPFWAPKLISELLNAFPFVRLFSDSVNATLSPMRDRKSQIEPLIYGGNRLSSHCQYHCA